MRFASLSMLIVSVKVGCEKPRNKYQKHTTRTTHVIRAYCHPLAAARPAHTTHHINEYTSQSVRPKAKRQNEYVNQMGIIRQQ